MHDDPIDRIEAAYAAARAGTWAKWAQHADAGPAAALPYDEAALAYTIGATFDAPPGLRPLLEELDALAAVDATISPVPHDALHFTFLAITPHRWDDVAAMPDAAAVRAAAARHLARLTFELDALRLLPGANALLLAGLPSRAMLAARDRLIADLVAVGVGPWLTERYGPTFPPVFWHTTLARARTAFAPTALRALYERHEATRFGTIVLSPPRLHAANFNWTRRLPIG